MSEQVRFYDLNQTFVYDPEEAGDEAVNLQWDSTWPKGYGVMTCTIRRNDVLSDWAVQESYGVRVYEGGDIVYSGRVEAIVRNLSGTDENIQIRAVGWYVVLQDTHIHKHWVDDAAMPRLRWPPGLENDADQTTFVTVKRENTIEIYAGSGDVSRSGPTIYRERYTEPAGHNIKQYSFSYRIRSGEGPWGQIWNVDDGSEEWKVTATAAEQSGTVTDDVLANPSSSIDIRFYLVTSDVYDQNDYFIVDQLTVEMNYHSSHSAYGSETYEQGELVEDLLWLVSDVNSSLSTDYTAIGSPGYTIEPFVVDRPTPAAQVIDRIASYGDSSLNQWGICIWGETASDGKPRIVFEQKPATTDYEYVLDLDDDQLRSMYYELDGTSLENYCRVRYTDTKGLEQFLTPGDDASLTDATSVANDYQRDVFLDVRDADSTVAGYVGARRIQFHKDRQKKATFSVIGHIDVKGGGKQKTCQIRAGQRVYVPRLDTTFALASVAYDAETQTARLSPDTQQDNVNLLLSQIKAELRSGV